MAEKVGEIYYDVTLELEQMIRDQRRAQQHLDKTADSLQKLAPIAAAAKAALSGLAVMKIIDMADQWGQYAIRIKQATKSAEEYAYVQDRMLASANSTFRSVQETRESFIQLSPVLREMGLTLGQSVDVIDTFSGLLVVNAASAEKAKGAQDALAKSLQKGKIDADAWMSIYSTLDSVVDIIAASSGKSATEIRKLGAEGKLGIEMLVKALFDGAPTVAKQVAEMPTTVRDALRAVMNGMQEYVGWSNQTHGITATISKAVKELGDNFNMLADIGLAAVTAGLARYSAGVVVSSVATAAKAATAMRAAAAEVALAEAEAAQTAVVLAQVRALNMATPAQVQLTAATVAHEAATKRLASAQAAQIAATASVGAAARGMLAFMTGPAGIAVAVALAAYSFVDFKARADKAAAGLVDMQKPLGEVIAKFKELNSLQRQRVIDLNAAEIKQQSGDIQKAIFDLGNSFQPSMAKGTRAAAQFRQNFVTEVQAAMGDTSMSGEELSDAVKAIIDKWAESMGWSDKFKASMVDQASKIVDLEGKQRNLVGTQEGLIRTSKELAAAANEAAGAMVKLGTGTVAGNAEAEKRLKELNKQIATFGKGASASLLYDIDNDPDLKGASDEFKRQLRERAAVLAKLEKGKTLGKPTLELDIEKIQGQMNKLVTIYSSSSKIIEAQRQAGLLDDEEYYRAKRSFIELESQAKEKALADEIDRYKRQKASGADAIDIQKKMAEARAKLEAQQIESGAALTELDVQETAAIRAKEVALLAARQAAQDYYDTTARGYAREEDSAWMGNSARQYAQGLSAVEERYSQQRRDLANQRAQAERQADGQLTAAAARQFDQQLAIIEEFQGKEVDLWKGHYAKTRADQEVWQNGAQEAYANYVESARNAAGQMQSVFEKGFQGMEDALTNFAMTGKLDFKDLANSIIADLVRIQIRAAMVGKDGDGGLLGSLLNTGISWLTGRTPVGAAGNAGYGDYSSAGMAAAFGGKRENGGDVAPGRMYEVNERGVPELLTIGNKQLLMMAGQSGSVSPLQGSGMNVASVPAPAASVAVQLQVEVNNYGGGEVQQRRETQKMPDGRVLEKLVLDIVGDSFASGTGAPYRGAKQRFNLRDA